MIGLRASPAKSPRIVLKEGLAYRGTPHSIRYTSITEAVHVPNSNVYDISRVAGHKNLRTTQRYMHTADERAHEAMAKLPKLATLRN